MLEQSVPFEHKIIDLSIKPTEFINKYAEAVGGATTGISAKVPLLEHGDNTKVVESDVVTKYIAQNIGPDDRMYPVVVQNDPTSRRNRKRVDEFLNSFDTVMDTYYDFLLAMSNAEVDQAKHCFYNALCNLQYNLLSEQDDDDYGPFCLGNQFSVAECIAAPWVHRFSLTIPYFRGVSVLTTSNNNDNNNHNDNIEKLILPSKVSNWMDAVLARPSVQATNGKVNYVLQSTENYYVRYITPGSPAADAAR